MSQSVITKDAIEAWLQAQLRDLQRQLGARQQAAETWSSGSDEDWRAVSSRLTKQQRDDEAAKELRIAAKIQADIICVQALVEMVSK